GGGARPPSARPRPRRAGAPRPRPAGPRRRRPRPSRRRRPSRGASLREHADEGARGVERAVVEPERVVGGRLGEEEAELRRDGTLAVHLADGLDPPVVRPADADLEPVAGPDEPPEARPRDVVHDRPAREAVRGGEEDGRRLDERLHHEGARHDGEPGEVLHEVVLGERAALDEARPRPGLELEQAVEEDEGHAARSSAAASRCSTKWTSRPIVKTVDIARQKLSSKPDCIAASTIASFAGPSIGPKRTWPSRSRRSCVPSSA